MPAGFSVSCAVWRCSSSPAAHGSHMAPGNMPKLVAKPRPMRRHGIIRRLGRRTTLGGHIFVKSAARFGIPDQWIRAVMAQESGGEEQAVSPVGAMGLMQLMPGTYQELQAEDGLGPDPFNPEDNILAGAAYIREMYDRYGAPGFLAAYNAGPEALDSYLAGDSQLPEETVEYLASVTPNLGNAVPMSGPLASYEVASASGAGSAPTIASFATGCDVNAAYDPDHPCTPAMADNIAATEQTPAPAGQASSGSCDLDTAYDPDSPCTAASGDVAGSQVASGVGACSLDAAYDPNAPCVPSDASTQVATVSEVSQQVPQTAAPEAGSALYQPVASPMVQPSPASQNVGPAAAPAPVTSIWAIQVGAFSSAGLARIVATSARAELPDEFRAAVIETPPTSPFGGLTLYRARLGNLSAQEATQACSRLNARQLPCIVVSASAA